MLCVPAKRSRSLPPRGTTFSKMGIRKLRMFRFDPIYLTKWSEGMASAGMGVGMHGSWSVEAVIVLI